MSEDNFEVLLETAMAALMSKQEALQQKYGLGGMARWWLNQETAALSFFDELDREVVRALIINIGSFVPKQSSWKWAWSNPSVPDALRERASPLKELQAITGFELFGDEEAFPIEDESMAWELAAFAVQHLKAVGCYRAPSSSDGPTIYLAITELKRIKH
ncbi:DUF6882 domain-containing protein [Pseudomonas sp. Ps21-P2]|uniref:DUF6882 domain-containing protein n=1 Tax=Pseudomonas sp. Ps21-P2 TaxID=3080331 RepID=UPI00320A6BE2